jgi:F-type H+-transporting ATPase subunit delta
MRKAKIIVADNITIPTYRYLCDELKKKLGKDLDFEYSIDNSIIGGFILNIDGIVYDNSIKTQLNRLKKHIRNGDES